MKITIITSPFGYIHPGGYGAVERRWFNVGREFSKQKNKVCFLSKTNESKMIKNENNPEYFYVIPVKGYKRTKYFCYDLFFDFIYSFKCLIRMPHTDILIMNTFWTPFFCGLFKYKYSISIYNVSRYPKGQFRYCLWTDMFFCVSNIIGEVLKGQLPDQEKKIKTINNPIDTSIYTYKGKNTTSDLTIMYHGRIHPEKGLEILVSAVEAIRVKYPQLKMILVGVRDIANGGGGEQYVRMLEKIAPGGISWVDPISDPVVLAEMISSCDIYCYPSVAEKGETFGVAPLEAMGIGRPVIVSALDCFKDFIKDQVNGFVFDHRSPNAVEELSAIIKKLIDNPDLRREIGLKAYHTSREFSNLNIANQYLAEFRGLLDKHE